MCILYRREIMGFRKPDVKAPRFRKRVKYVISNDFLDKFRRRFPEHRLIKHEMFSEIMQVFHDQLIQGIIDNRDGIELPEGLGFIFVATCQKAKKPKIDYKASIAANRKITFQNWESDNRLMKIMYSNTAVKYKLSNKQVWGFRVCRSGRLTISNRYRQQWQKYHVIPNMKGIHKMFENRVRKNSFRERKQILPADYNEFKMD